MSAQDPYTPDREAVIRGLKLIEGDFERNNRGFARGLTLSVEDFRNELIEACKGMGMHEKDAVGRPDACPTYQAFRPERAVLAVLKDVLQLKSAKIISAGKGASDLLIISDAEDCVILRKEGLFNRQIGSNQPPLDAATSKAYSESSAPPLLPKSKKGLKGILIGLGITGASLAILLPAMERYRQGEILRQDHELAERHLDIANNVANAENAQAAFAYLPKMLAEFECMSPQNGKKVKGWDNWVNSFKPGVIQYSDEGSLTIPDYPHITTNLMENEVASINQLVQQHDYKFAHSRLKAMHDRISKNTDLSVLQAGLVAGDFKSRENVIEVLSTVDAVTKRFGALVEGQLPAAATRPSPDSKGHGL